MFTKDGVVYASEPCKELRVTAVRALPYAMLLLTFSSGEQRLFDLTTLEGSAFEPLKQESVQHTVAVFHGAVTWLDGEIDCSRISVCPQLCLYRPRYGWLKRYIPSFRSPPPSARPKAQILLFV